MDLYPNKTLHHLLYELVLNVARIRTCFQSTYFCQASKQMQRQSKSTVYTHGKSSLFETAYKQALTSKLTPTGNSESPINLTAMCVFFGLWEETGVAGEKPTHVEGQRRSTLGCLVFQNNEIIRNKMLTCYTQRISN